jgi:hypothetical protein
VVPQIFKISFPNCFYENVSYLADISGNHRYYLIRVYRTKATTSNIYRFPKITEDKKFCIFCHEVSAYFGNLFRGPVTAFRNSFVTNTAGFVNHLFNRWDLSLRAPGQSIKSGR